MAVLIPPRPQSSTSSSVILMFRLLKKLDDNYTVRHLLGVTVGPQFLVIWRDRHAFLIRVAATSQELAESALSPSFFADTETFSMEEMEDAKGFGSVAPELPVCRLVVFPNVDNSTIDQIERLRSEDTNVSFLGLKQTRPDRFANHLEALAEAPLSEPMLLALRDHFDRGSRIRSGIPAREKPLLRRGDDKPLPSTFLDLDQEMLAKLDLALPAESSRLARRFETRLVTGPAGSGKSLVLLHRALFAARLNRRSRLLLLTHNRPINGELIRQATATAPEGSRIQGLTFFQWAMKFLPQRPKNILSRHDTLRRIETLMATDRGSLSPAFVAEEIGYLRDLGIASVEQYLDLERHGRFMALTGSRRKDIWNLLENYRESLRQGDESDWHEMALRFGEIARQHPERLCNYDFIFIDEAQFFAKTWFEPVLAALRPGGQLFLAADPTQGFLKRRESWLAAGIEVRGRSNRLSKPYRSTRAILRFARDMILQRAALYPDSTEGFDPPSEEEIAGIVEDGEAPIVLPAASGQNAVSRLVREIGDLQNRSPQLAGNVLVLHADSFAASGVIGALRAKLGHANVNDLNSRVPQPENAFCAVSNCLAATGLEAAVVFLLGVDPLLDSEADPRLDSDARAELAADHTKLLYMACTRAARRLVIFSNRWPQ